MPSNPNKAEEIWEGRSHSALDRGDIRRMLLAIFIIGTFACLEVGIFLFTLEEKPGGISSRPGQDNRPARVQVTDFMGEGPQVHRAEKREKGYVQAWLRLQGQQVPSQPISTLLQMEEEEPLGCQDSPGPQQPLPPGANGPSCQ